MLDAQSSDPSDLPPNLPLNDMQEALEKCLQGLSGRVKNCARSAYHHLRKSWALYNVDKEMCAFRAITAEEEAATALILALKQKNYPGASRLNHRNHAHKSAVTPFVNAVESVLALMQFAHPKIRVLSDATPPRIEVVLDANASGLPSPEPMQVLLNEPLNFSISKDGQDGVAAVHMFEEQLQRIAEGSGASSIKAFVGRESNIRNQLLYASDQGVPSVTFPPSFIIERRERVNVLVGLTIAVLQTPNHQLFARQCLHGLLKSLERLSGASEVPELPPEQTDGIFISKLGDGHPTALIRKTYIMEGVLGVQLLQEQKVTIDISKLDRPYTLPLRRRKDARRPS